MVGYDVVVFCCGCVDVKELKYLLDCLLVEGEGRGVDEKVVDWWVVVSMLFCWIVLKVERLLEFFNDDGVD